MRSRSGSWACLIAGAVLAFAWVEGASALVNPASAYCDALGYTPLSSEDGQGGEVAACELPNGQVVDAWQFLVGNVASDYGYCARQGLAQRVVESDEMCLVFLTDSCAVCVQPDGTEVEVTKLMGLRFDESRCGDGTCGFPETFDRCPQDCDEANRSRPVAEEPRDDRPVAELLEVGDTGPAEVVVPVLMYSLERYFAGAKDRTSLDTTVADILDEASPETRSLLQRALQGYRDLPAATRAARFDAQAVKLTASPTQSLDLGKVRQRWGQVEPTSVSPPKGPPAAPKGLQAANASTLPDPDVPGSGKHGIQLSWQTGSTDQDGFVIERSAKLTKSGAPASSSFKPLTTVGRGVTQFLDALPKPAAKTDRYCYRVRAYRAAPFQLVGQPPARVESPPSKVACSDYATKAGPVAVDTDKDGVPDASDACPYEHKGAALWTQGCPDVDQDGVADKDDACPLDWGDAPVPGDKAPTPKAGCPYTYTLRWMRMEVLNNSGPFAYSNFKFQKDGQPIYNEVRHDCPGMHKGADCSTYVGEEPYLLFSFVNGRQQGAPYVYTTRWCCGERVDVKAGQSIEPDSDTDFEEDPLAIDDLLKKGLTIFPSLVSSPSTSTDVIDRKYGLSMTATLMERDFSRAITLGSQADPLGTMVKLTGSVAGAISGCAGSGGLGCLMSIGNAIKNVVESIFGLSQGSATPVHVDDPDDLMGSGVWGITRLQAQSKTANDGAYGFWFPVPTDIVSSCMGAMPCTTATSIPVTMRAKLRFCLVRDGIPESKVAKLCAPYEQILPWPMKP